MYNDVTLVEALKGLKESAFDHIPQYCRPQAMQAIAYVRQLEKTHVLRKGVYYVVLSDLCGATIASSVLGATLNQKRVESFITLCVETLSASEVESYAQFVKPVGDATLFLFSSFPDLYKWWRGTQDRMLTVSHEESVKLTSEKRKVYQLQSKTVIHVGEVLFSGGNDPVAEAVNQVFKIEKSFAPGELGSTDIAKIVASPFFPDLNLSPKALGEEILPGDKRTVTWLLAKDERYCKSTAAST